MKIKSFIILISILVIAFAGSAYAGGATDNRGYARNGRLEEYDKAAKASNSAGVDKSGYYRDPEYRRELESGMSQDEWEAKQAARDKMKQWEYEHREELEEKARLRRIQEAEEQARLREEQEKKAELTRQWLEREERLHQEELKRQQEEQRLAEEKRKREEAIIFNQELKFLAGFIVVALLGLLGAEYYKKQKES